MKQFRFPLQPPSCGLQPGAVVNILSCCHFTYFPAACVRLCFTPVSLRHFGMSRMRDEEGRSHESLGGRRRGGRAGRRAGAGSGGHTTRRFPPSPHAPCRRLRPEPLFPIAQSNPIQSAATRRRPRPTIHVTLLVISSYPGTLSLLFHLRRRQRVDR